MADMKQDTVNHLALLADYIASVRWDDLPDGVKKAAYTCCIDSTGAAVGGVGYEETPAIIENFLKYSGRYDLSAPGASVWGTSKRTSVFQAALLNGILAHSLELDDVHTGSKTHIGAVVLPAAWAVAEAVKAPGIRLLEAVFAGYETMSRIGRGFGVAEHRLRGWHVTGTAGTFGAAAAAAKLLGLDAPRTLDALGMAGTQSSGLWAFLENGSTSKKFHTGRAAENGVVAAFLAQSGMTGPGGILDAQDGGLYKAMSSGGDVREVSRGLGSVFEIEKVDRKPYSCCRSMHPALDGILQIRAERQAPPGEVESISIRSYEVGVKQCGVIRYPVNVSESKFCMRFGVAAAYIDGSAGQEQFSMARINDEAVRSLASRIEYSEDAEFTGRYPKSWGAAISVRFKDGSAIEKEILDASGSVANPVTDAQIDRKFTELVTPALGGKGAERALRSLKHLHEASSVEGILSPEA